MAVNGVEIQVGQTWRTRGCGSVEITGHVPNDPWPWSTSDDSSVTNDGFQFSDAEENPGDLMELLSGPGFAPPVAAPEMQVQMLDLPADAAYISLADVLKRAYEQASSGKGKERHASGDTPFEEQPMATINRQLGSIDGFIYQAHKKSLEAKRLPNGRAQAELLGAINYLAGAVIALDTWANTEGGV